MIVVMGIGVEGGHQTTQAVHMAQLREDQGHKMSPALERLVVGVPVPLLHNPVKPTPIQRFEKAREDAISVAHARLLSESRQPESTREIPVLPGMRPRPSDSFPGQPCRLREREGPIAKRWEGEGMFPAHPHPSPLRGATLSRKRERAISSSPSAASASA